MCIRAFGRPRTYVDAVGKISPAEFREGESDSLVTSLYRTTVSAHYRNQFWLVQERTVSMLLSSSSSVLSLFRPLLVVEVVLIVLCFYLAAQLDHVS